VIQLNTSSQISISEYVGSSNEDVEITSFLTNVFVLEGYTELFIAQKSFRIAEIKKRGTIILARNAEGRLLGTIICVVSSSPYKQVATSDEAEIQLLAVDPKTRGQGVGQKLCQAFEEWATKAGYTKAVLSTQESMHAAHRLYVKLGYCQNLQRSWKFGKRTFFVFEKVLNGP
jgi:ribosomal protein S18 acetylase RimI-like enzyme